MRKSSSLPTFSKLRKPPPKRMFLNTGNVKVELVCRRKLTKSTGVIEAMVAFLVSVDCSSGVLERFRRLGTTCYLVQG